MDIFSGNFNFLIHVKITFPIAESINELTSLKIVTDCLSTKKLQTEIVEEKILWLLWQKYEEDSMHYEEALSTKDYVSKWSLLHIKEKPWHGKN